VVDAGLVCSPRDWFDSTGDWQEWAGGAFGGNLKRLADEVRSAGLGFGLWMEPEHIGRKSPPRAPGTPDWFVGGNASADPLDLENPSPARPRS